MNFNKIIIAGRVTKDIEMKSGSKNGKDWNLGKFSVAVDGTDSTIFYNVTVWNERALGLQNHILKGTQVLVEGQPKLEKWDGGAAISIDFPRVEICFERKSASAAKPTASTAKTAPVAKSQEFNTDLDIGSEDDIPF